MNAQLIRDPMYREIIGAMFSKQREMNPGLKMPTDFHRAADEHDDRKMLEKIEEGLGGNGE